MDGSPFSCFIQSFFGYVIQLEKAIYLFILMDFEFAVMNFWSFCLFSVAVNIICLFKLVYYQQFRE